MSDAGPVADATVDAVADAVAEAAPDAVVDALSDTSADAAADAGAVPAPVVGTLTTHDLSTGNATTYAVNSYAFGILAGQLAVGGGASGKPTFQDLSVTLPSSDDPLALVAAATRGTPFQDVSISIPSPVAGKPPVTIAVFQTALVSGAETVTDVTGEVSSVVTFHYVSFQLFNGTSSAGQTGCTAACCTSSGVAGEVVLGPYVQAAAGWPTPPATLPVDSFAFSESVPIVVAGGGAGGGAGKPVFAPASYEETYGDDALCAYAATLGGPLAPGATTKVPFHLESPASATTGNPLDSETFTACYWAMSSLGVVSTASGPVAKVALNALTFLDQTFTYDATGALATHATFGWNTLTNASVASCP